MNRRRRRSNPWLIVFLVLAIAFVAYLNVFIIPTVPAPFVPTPTPTRNPESFVQEAETYLAEGRVSSAVDSYIAAIKAEPQNINNYLSLATLQIYTGDYEAARVNAENAILLDKSLPQAFVLLGWAKGLQQDYLNAEADITTALDMDPNNALAHAVYAYVLAQRVADDVAELDTLDTAIEESKLALRLSPNLMEAHWARGYVLEITANYDEAVEELISAIDINDNIAELHLALGRNYVAIGENDQAVFEFTAAYALNPTDPEPNWYISRVYGQIGEYAKAIQYAEQAVKDDPTNPYMYGNLGTLYYRDLQYNAAIATLAYAVRGGVTDEGDVVEGLPLDYTTTIMEYYSRYGLALARVNSCNDAVQVAQALLQTVPDDEDTVYNANYIIGICQENLENPATATPDGDEGGAAPEMTPTPTVAP
ncbi:tetratricopeptide repeat protein [Chloroflexota bacterium]|nr:tetratricopeptide repeat protein [Chloroflexota bacterium]